MRRIMCLIACCCLGSIVLAGEPKDKGGKLTDPKEILRRAEKTVKEVKLVKYKASYKGTKWARQFVPDMEVRALAGQPAEFDVPRFYCNGTVTKIKPAESEEAASGDQAASDDKSAAAEKAPETETVRINLGCDGDQYFLIDVMTMMIHRDMDPAVLGTRGSDVRRIFIAPDAFENALKSEEIELKGEITIGGEPCYEIHAKVDAGPQQAEVWAVSIKDFYPRNVKRMYKMPDYGDEIGTTELTITELTINPNLGDNPFRPVVPAGFQKTDEFAP